MKLGRGRGKERQDSSKSLKNIYNNTKGGELMKDSRKDRRTVRSTVPKKS